MIRLITFMIYLNKYYIKFLQAAGDPATDLPFGNTKDNLTSAIAGETYVCFFIILKYLYIILF